jgi:hypothetical protein
MDAGSTLEAIAQIGVALAGFAGVVGALAGELRPADPGIWLPFWVMISSGLTIVFAALFPFLPYYFGAPDRVIWVASSTFVTILTACNLVYFTPRFLRAQHVGVLAGTLAFSVFLHIISFLLLVSQILNILGVGLSQSVGGFLIGLYLMLLISVLNFVFLLYVLGSPSSNK